MSSNFPLATMLTAIRNGQGVRLARIDAPFSKLCRDVLKVLQEEGYIAGFEENEIRKGVKRLSVALKYFEGQPVIREIKNISRPGLRRYAAADQIKRVRNGLGITILSTSKGVMADHQAKTANAGGELLCSVF